MAEQALKQLSSLQHLQHIEQLTDTLQHIKTHLVQLNRTHRRTLLNSLLSTHVRVNFITFMTPHETNALWYWFLETPGVININDVLLALATSDWSVGDLQICWNLWKRIIRNHRFAELQDSTTRNELVQLLVSIPDRLSARLGERFDELPTYLHPRTFYKTVMSQMLDTEEPELTLVAAFASKLSILHRADVVVEVTLSRIRQNPDEYFGTIILGKMYNDSLEKLLKELVKQAPSSEEVGKLCDDLMRKRTRAYHVIVHRILLKDYTILSKFQVKLLCDLLVRFGNAQEALKEVEIVWGDETIVHAGSTEMNLRLARILCHLIPESDIEINLATKHISDGVQIRLDASDKELVRIALKVGRQLSKKLAPDHEFDKGDQCDMNDSDDDIMEHTESKDEVPIVWDDDDADELVDSTDNDEADELWDFEDEHNFILDDGVINLDFPSVDHSRNPKSLKPPVYALDVVDYLRRGRKVEERAYAQSALKRIAEDIDHVLDVTPYTMKEMTKHILSLSDCDTNERLSALVNLAAGFPKMALPYMTEEIASRSLGIKDRLLILDTIYDTSKIFLKETRLSSDFPIENVKEGSPGSELDLVSKRVKENTRVWGSMKRQHIVKSQNRLVEVCGDMFYPVLSNAFEICTGISDSLVLSRILYTLSSILEDAVEALVPYYQLRQMSRGLWDLTNALRFNENALVRRSCVFSFSRILLAHPNQDFVEDFSGELLELSNWLQLLSTQDPDEVSREISQLCLQHLNKTYLLPLLDY